MEFYFILSLGTLTVVQKKKSVLSTVHVHCIFSSVWLDVLIFPPEIIFFFFFFFFSSFFFFFYRKNIKKLSFIIRVIYGFQIEDKCRYTNFFVYILLWMLPRQSINECDIFGCFCSA